MASAYTTLGIPGNASPQDIETAFQRARDLYTKEHMATVEGALERFEQVKTAYAVLRDPDSRAAHDRKLAAELRPRPRTTTIVVEEESPTGKYLKRGLILVAVLFAAGLFISYKNAEARKEQAALELAAKQEAAKEEERRQAETARLEQERARAKEKAEANDKQVAYEGQLASARASMENARQEATAVQMQRAALAEQQRHELAARAEERRNADAARQRVEADKRRIRELCYQQYRKYDC